MQGIECPDSEPAPEASRRYYVGTSALNLFREGMEVKCPVQDGLIQDWDCASKLYDFALREVLRVNPREHPVLLSEPGFNTSALREKTTEFFFEHYQVPAFFLCKNRVLSSFVYGRATSAVVESGGGTTVVTPVHNGYALTKAIVRSPLAGDELTRIYRHVVEKAGIEIRPGYMLNKKQAESGEFKVSLKNLAGVTESFHSYQVNQILQSLKEETCQTISPAEHKFRIPEILFNPSRFVPADYPRYEEFRALPGIHQMLVNSISACDSDIRKDLYQNIAICGGNTLFPEFQDRFIAEVNTLTAQQKKIRNQSLPFNAERKYSVFIGGSILGCLGTFHLMWISKQEYEEHGRSIADRKCP
ncbi:uncharacterized protein LOC126322683 [Schistocerca gregaria]|uniref:uncharacterized protein LOC126322683 n=1 Tax=Schistocerca gregaria TaxID=7010 RepID=UPI00211DE020|nr:uncharacterized protein LOC126322683 [Schistocerca gregaria]